MWIPGFKWVAAGLQAESWRTWVFNIDHVQDFQDRIQDTNQLSLLYDVVESSRSADDFSQFHKARVFVELIKKFGLEPSKEVDAEYKALITSGVFGRLGALYRLSGLGFGSKGVQEMLFGEWWSGQRGKLPGQ